MHHIDHIISFSNSEQLAVLNLTNEDRVGRVYRVHVGEGIGVGLPHHHRMKNDREEREEGQKTKLEKQTNRDAKNKRQTDTLRQGQIHTDTDRHIPPHHRMQLWFRGPPAH